MKAERRLIAKGQLEIKSVFIWFTKLSSNISKYGMTWILVFWLQFPENYTQHAVYTSEKECRDAENAWNRRLRIVKSQLQAECRQQ